jgi:hypothetical protein
MVSHIFGQLPTGSQLLIHISLVVVLLHYHSVEMSIFELGLSNPTPSASSYSHDFHRLETLHSCLKATQVFFEIFLSLPVDLARSLSFITFKQGAFGLVMLHKLSTFESQDWDLNYVRQTVNFGKVLDQLMDWFDKVKTADLLERRSSDENNIFSRGVRKLGRIKAWHEQKAESVSLDPQVSSTIVDADVALNGAPADFFNEAWLEMLGPWDNQYNTMMA